MDSIQHDQSTFTTATTDFDNDGNYLSLETMRAAQEDGRATPLSPHLTEFLRYDQRWWVESDDAPGWIVVTDQALLSVLDQGWRWSRR